LPEEKREKRAQGGALGKARLAHKCKKEGEQFNALETVATSGRKRLDRDLKNPKEGGVRSMVNDEQREERVHKRF